MLAWTTTPWTLPGNGALAINEEIDYCLVERDRDRENYVLAKDRAASSRVSQMGSAFGASLKVKNLVGLEYEPLYEIPAVKSSNKNSTMSFRLISSPPKTDGHCPHCSAMHGEDDYNVGVRYDLPIIPLLGSSGHFNKEAPEFIQGF